MEQSESIKSLIKSTDVSVFATYYNKEVKAIFNTETSKVLYRGEYYTPSGAAKKVKEEVQGRQITANGWDFWKYRDENGNER